MSTRSGWSRSGFPLLFCCLLACPSQGQVVQLARFESKLGRAEFEYQKIISLKEKGLLLHRRVIMLGEVQMEITKLDTALHQVWKGYIPLDQNILVLQSRMFDSNLFMLLRNGAQNVANFQVLRINAESGEYKIYNIANLILLQVKDFVVTQQAIWIGGSFDLRPLVLYFNFTKGEATVLPGMLNSRGELMQMRGNEDGSVDVVIGARNIEKQKSLWLNKYDPRGNLAKAIVIEPGPKKNLIFGQSVRISGDEQVVAGVYGRFTGSSRGIFVAHVDPGGEYQINYYNLGDLQNFFNYMKPRRTQRIKERIERRKKEGKQIKFNYQFLVHSLIPYKDKYILLGEAFVPTYRNTYGMGAISSYSIFDGYKYSHAVVAGFTKNGKLIWDNIFEINDLKSFQLEQFVKIHPGENEVEMIYLSQGAIHSKLISGETVIEDKTSEFLGANTKDSPILIMSTEWAKLEYWHSKNFYIWGVQYVRNLTQQDQESGKVFFITKVSYR